MTVGKKLYLGAASAVVAASVMGVSAWFSLSSLGKITNRLSLSVGKKVYLSGDINAAMSDVIAEQQAIIIGAYRHQAAEIKKAEAEFEASYARIERDIQIFSPLIESEKGRVSLAGIQQGAVDVLASHKELALAAEKGDLDAALGIFDSKLAPQANRTNSLADDLARYQNSLMVKASDEAAAKIATNKWVQTGLLLICIFSGGVLFTQKSRVQLKRLCARRVRWISPRLKSQAPASG